MQSQLFKYRWASLASKEGAFDKKESLCYRTTVNRLKNESNTTRGTEKNLDGSCNKFFSTYRWIVLHPGVNWTLFTVETGNPAYEISGTTFQQSMKYEKFTKIVDNTLLYIYGSNDCHEDGSKIRVCY